MSIEDVDTLKEKDWRRLLDRIEDGKCTPFLGAGVNGGFLPTGSSVSRAWAKEFGYPLDNCDALDQVAEFIAIDQDAMYPKECFIELLHSELAKIGEPTLGNFLVSPEQPLAVLASLPLPVYITTNYDNLLMRALAAQGKKPRRELCRWNKYLKDVRSVFDSADGFTPDKDNPVVFHLHGHDDVPESLVLTEDDYLDFLVNVSRARVLPPQIEQALTGASLLFVGYRLADINFRVIFRGLIGSLDASLRRISISVQHPRKVAEGNSEQVKHYLAKYFKKLEVQVYWGSAEGFAQELGERWRKYKGGV